MTLTDDHKVQIFCAALHATGHVVITHGGVQSGAKNLVDLASNLALEAIKKLQSDEWTLPPSQAR